jgi:protein SCO1/2
MNSKLIWFTAAATALALPSMPAGELPTNGVRRACCCRSDGTAATTLSDGTRTACCRSAETAATTLSDKSLYQLDSTWTNDAGASLKLASLKGRPQLVCMFFANCQYACPLLVYKMKQLEAALPENLRNNIGFLLVSFDTERDTPAVLHEYRVNHELAAGRWNLLHGGPDDVQELSALLGVKFKKDAQGQFMHSNLLTVLNPQGEIAFQETRLDLSVEPLVRKLKQQSFWPAPPKE